ncbi:MAG: hypothetical protein ACOY3K_05020 [Candidatus Omnitrophota bacterium]
MKIPHFQNAILYFSPDNDAFYKIRNIWNPHDLWKKAHPLIGWVRNLPTAENPLGLDPATLSILRENAPKIFFYGDSYVTGMSNNQIKIPDFMDEKTRPFRVASFACASYGLDQIFLMFKNSYALDPDALFLVGIYMDDIHRLILSYRTLQKPFFDLSPTGELVLKGLPLDPDQRSYLKRNPLFVGSYFLRFLHRYFLKESRKQRAALRERKEKVTSALIREFARIAKRENRRLAFVLFFNESDMGKEPWQRKLLVEEFRRHEVPFVATDLLLKDHARKNGLALSAFYDPENYHHSDLGNQVIADGLLEFLERQGWLGDRADPRPLLRRIPQDQFAA